MREIKFRAWDKREGLNRMWYLDGFVKYGDGWNGGNPDYKFYELHFGAGFAKVSASDTVIMQYTGLKDKNGKEIYEGDIIRCYESDGKTEIKHTISYDDSGARFIVTSVGYKNLFGGFDQKWINEFKKEVIGNIYENPELL